jgi:DNA-binding NarL/FixJ family response regulator
METKLEDRSCQPDQQLNALHRPVSEVEKDVKLTPRESEILELLAMGYLYKEIGERLNIGTETVRTHVKKIRNKMHVRGRLEAVVKHIRGSIGTAKPVGIEATIPIKDLPVTSKGEVYSGTLC